MKTLAERLAEARSETGLSQGALAKQAGCGQSTIASIERGRNQGSTILPRLAEILGVNALWLSEGRGPMRPGAAPPPALPEPSNVSADLALSPALADLLASARPLPDADVRLLTQMARRIARADFADKTRRLIESGGQDAGLEGLLSTQDMKPNKQSAT